VKITLALKLHKLSSPVIKINDWENFSFGQICDGKFAKVTVAFALSLLNRGYLQHWKTWIKIFYFQQTYKLCIQIFFDLFSLNTKNNPIFALKKCYHRRM